MTPTYSDQEWIRRLRQGDEAARQALWLQLYQWAQCQKLAPVGPDAAVSAYELIMTRGIYQYQFHCPFLGYCRVILSNQVNSHLRRLPAELDPLDEERHGAGQETTLTAAPEQIQRRLTPCLEQLSERQQDIAHRLYWQNQTPQTAAEALGLSRNNLNAIIHRARRRLRDCLQKRGYHSVAEALSWGVDQPSPIEAVK